MKHLFFVLIVLFFWTPCILADSGQAPLRVGIIVPLTGDLAAIGAGAKHAFELAQADLSAGSVQLDLKFEDDAGQPKSTVTAFRKLRDTFNPDIFITVASSTSKAVAPIADEIKIPLIAIASDGAVSKGREYVVNFWVTPEQEVKVLIPEAVRRGYKRIALITGIHDGTLSFRDAFDRLNNGQIEVVYNEEVPIESRDFRTTLTKLKRVKGVDAIFSNLFLGQIGLFARQARELGINQPLFTIELFEDENEVKLSKGALIDQWYVQADDPQSHFLRRFRELYPGVSTFGAGNAYDSIALIHAWAKNPHGKTLNQFLHEVQNFPGVLGTFSASGDNRFNLPAVVKVVKEDGFERLGATP